jgi:predicted nucleotidyltransferase
MSAEFWINWKNKTEIERRAINSIFVAQKILFENVSRDKIYAIYIKGSFVRREMNENSDVDIVPITDNNDALEEIKKLEKTKGTSYKPSEFLPHSLEEFEHGRKNSEHNALKGNVDGFLRNIHNYKLIYGVALDTSKYPVRSDKEFLKGHINAFKNTFIPLYKQKKFSFSELIKQIFFLVEREERVNDREPPYSWKALSKSIKDKKHIIHDALRHRLHPTKDLKKREELIIKLNDYINELSKLTI